MTFLPGRDLPNFQKIDFFRIEFAKNLVKKCQKSSKKALKKQIIYVSRIIETGFDEKRHQNEKKWTF